MILFLKRIAKREAYTIGKLYINGEYFCDTIEDKDRGLNAAIPVEQLKKAKVYGQTAIPTGTYKIGFTVSGKFKNRSYAKPYEGKVLCLYDVPAFEGIRIHPGNTAEDSLGCILPGKNKVVGQVIESTATYLSLVEKIVPVLEADESVYIQIA